MIKAEATIVVVDDGNLYVNGVNIDFGATDGCGVSFHADGDSGNVYGCLEQAIKYCLEN